jgi:hypothetical protein
MMAKFEVQLDIKSNPGFPYRFVDKSLEGAEAQAIEWLTEFRYTESDIQEMRRYFIDQCAGKFRIDLN